MIAILLVYINKKHKYLLVHLQKGPEDPNTKLNPQPSEINGIFNFKAKNKISM